MDFLKNLKLDDNDNKETKTTEHQQGSQLPHKEGGGGFFGKISETLGGGQHTELAAPPQEPPRDHHREGSGGVFDIINDVVGGQHHSQPPPVSPPKHEGLLDKISSALGGEQHTPAPPPPKPEGLLGTLSASLSGTHHGAETSKKPEDGSLLGKISGVLGGQHSQESVQHEGGLANKINSALGGGAAGEKKEDGLDKAVDFIQEHIFHAGPQNNESAIEQVKDEQISDTIRHQYQKLTGKAFPIADKD